MHQIAPKLAFPLVCGVHHRQLVVARVQQFLQGLVQVVLSVYGPDVIDDHVLNEHQVAQHLVFGQVEVFEADHAAQAAVVIGDDKV